MNRHFACCALLAGAVLAASACAVPSAPAAAATPTTPATPQASAAVGKPNIVFILVDNVGWGDFGVYGGTTPTPRIDRLANEGIRFNNYNVEPQCTQTRSAIMTGRHPIRSGTWSVVPARRAASSG